MNIKTDYWREAGEGLHESDYPEVAEEDVSFPTEIFVAYAVCQKGCGRREFIVDGSTQICMYCGKSMFRIVSRKYILAPESEQGDPEFWVRTPSGITIKSPANE